MPRAALKENGQQAVVQVLNSTFGARGQIGFRATFVKALLDRLRIPNSVLARDYAAAASNVVRVLPFGQLVPRALNGYRMLLNPRFDNRWWDTRLFDRFATPHLRSELLRAGSAPVVHLWESSPVLARLAHEYSAKLVVDVPIAPAHEVVRLMRAGLSSEIRVDGVNPREDETLALADLIIAPSDYVRGVLLAMGVGADKICTVPFGCTVRPLHARKSSNASLTFLFAGTLSRRKGLRFLLEAWTRDGFEDDRLILCGRLTRMARELLQEYPAANIETPGHVDLDPYLDRADIFVLPTLMEGSAKAVYEAMGAGLPVITTANSGTIATSGQEAMLVPVGDATALRETMLMLKHDASLRERLGAAARTKAMQFTWERYAERVVDVYRKA